ncbi:MAG: hypothetical protein A3F10_00405 [Coxiella sp. RIFCSPHIGHO2_12_FULL_42_15]|nr:MAG: hypothetical protein A3F10_00405 [Coxiella sp. RIFCSPHIGHO2_12_FULL_42_15]
MAKAFKVIGSIIAMLVILFIIAIIITALMFNPNRYHQQIEQWVYHKTQHPLTIQGKMKWSYFPWIGIEIPKVTLGNPTGFKGPALANIQNLKIKVKLLPLFSGKVEIDDIGIQNAIIHLIINQNYQPNWQFSIKAKTAQINAAPSSKKSSSHLLPIHGFSIRNLTIENSAIHFINQPNNTAWNILKFNFTINNFDNNKEFPLLMAFNFDQGESQHNAFQNQLSAHATVNLLTQHVDVSEFAINTVILRPELPKIPLSAKGKISLDMHQENLSLNKLALTFANMKLNGSARLTHFLSVPHFQLNLASEKTDIENFVKTLQNKDYITGTLTMKTTLTAQGASTHQIETSLTGNGSIAIDNGTVKGIDIEGLLQQAIALIHKQPQPTPAQNKNETPFFKISANYMIENGILRNNDLLFQGQKIRANGMGSVDLVNNEIDYQLDAQYSQSQQNTEPDFSLPILITGKTNHPKIVPDFPAIAKKYLKQQIKDFINNKSKDIGKTLENLFR